MKKNHRIKTASLAEKEKYLEYLRQDKSSLAIKELEKLCVKYPNDKKIIFDYASLLLRQNRDITKAKLLFSLIEDRENQYSIAYELGTFYLNNSKFEQVQVGSSYQVFEDENAINARHEFYKLLNGSKKIKCKGYINLVKLDVRLGRFEDAYYNYCMLSEIAKACNFDIPYQSNLLFYLLYKTNRLSEEKLRSYEETNYYARQAINYNPSEVIDHITKDSDPDNPNKLFMNIYSSIHRNVDISSLYSECEETIKDSIPTGYSITGDYYLVKLKDNKEIGISPIKEPTSTVEVFTFPSTKNIITIHPTSADHINRRFEDDINVVRKKPLTFSSGNSNNNTPFEI